MGGKKKTKWRKLPPEELSHITIKRRDEQRINSNQYDETAFKNLKHVKHYNGSETQGTTKVDEELNKNIYLNESVADNEVNGDVGFYANGIWVPVSHMHNTARIHQNHSDIIHTIPVILHQSSSISPPVCPPFHSYHTLDGSFPTSYFIPNNSHYFYYLTKSPIKENEQIEEQYSLGQNSIDDHSHRNLSTTYNISENHAQLPEILKPVTYTTFDSDKTGITENDEIYENINNPNYVPDWPVDQSNITYEYPGYGFGQSLYSVPLYVLFPPADSQTQFTSSWPTVPFQKRRKRRRKSYAEYAVIPKKSVSTLDSRNKIEKHSNNAEYLIEENVFSVKEIDVPKTLNTLEENIPIKETRSTQSNTEENILTNQQQENLNHEQILPYINNLVENILQQAITEVIKKLKYDNKHCNENHNNIALVNNTNNDKEIANETLQYILNKICQEQTSHIIVPEIILYNKSSCLKENQSNLLNREKAPDSKDDHNSKNIEFVTEDGEKFLASLIISRDLKQSTLTNIKTKSPSSQRKKYNMSETNQGTYEQVICSDLPRVHKSHSANNNFKFAKSKQNVLFRNNDNDDNYNGNETCSAILNENINCDFDSQNKFNKFDIPSYMNSSFNNSDTNQFPDNCVKSVSSENSYIMSQGFTSHEELNDNFVKNNSPSQCNFASHSVSSDVLIRENEFELNKLRQLTSNSNQSIYKLAYDDQPESEDNNTFRAMTKNELQCSQSCKNIQPEFSHSEIIIHEVDSGSDAGSEDVELLPHRYESDASKGCNKHIYVNNLSLAVELLRTRESLPYDHEFKRIVDDDIDNEIQEGNTESIRTISGALNPGFIGDNTPNSQSQSVDHLELKKVHSIIQSEPEYKKMFRNSIIDSGVQSEDSDEEIGEEVKDTSEKQNESSDQCKTNLRRLGTQARQRFNIYSPRASIMNPCFCCCIM